MKKILKYIFPLLLLTACVDSLDEYNVDAKQASAVPAKTLFTTAMKGLTDILTTPNVNSNNYRLFVQYWTTTTYIDEPRYSMTGRLYSQNLWNAIYRDVLSDLNESKRLVNQDKALVSDVKNNQLAIIEIMEVYSWTVLVNTFGDVPYQQALDTENLLPVYDDASTIFTDLTERLDDALSKLTPGAASFGTADVIYSGDAGKWLKFANSLKVKMGMQLADANPSVAKAMVEAAATNVIALDNQENARFPYISAPPNNNPISSNLNPIFTSREDFIVTSVIVDALLARNDPRVSTYFTTVGGQYVGGNYGFSNNYGSYSHVGTAIISPTLEGILLESSEIAFLLAEAAARNFNVPMSAEEYYNAGVTASIKYWGGSEADAVAYLAHPGVDFSSPASGVNYKEKIGIQKWIALFNRGWESWTQWRRLDYPTLTPPSGNGITNALNIPVRMIYPISEQTLNASQWATAAGRFNNDSPNAKLFWDVF